VRGRVDAGAQDILNNPLPLRGGRVRVGVDKEDPLLPSSQPSPLEGEGGSGCKSYNPIVKTKILL